MASNLRLQPASGKKRKLKFDQPTRLALGVGAAVVMAAIWYPLIYAPSQNQLSTDRSVTEELNARVERALAARNALPALQQRHDQLNDQMNKFLARIPASENTASILSSLNLGLVSQGLQNGSVVRTAEGLKLGDLPIEQSSFSVRASGPYLDHVQFFSWLQDQSRLYSLSAIHFATGEGNTVSGDYTVTAFTYIDAPAGQTTTPTTTPGTAPATIAPTTTAPTTGTPTTPAATSAPITPAQTTSSTTGGAP